MLTTTHRRVILTGSDNFKDWERSILARLIQKDLDEVIEEDATLPLQLAEEKKSWLKKDKKAWAAIDESLSAAVHNVLPPNLLDLTSTPTGLLAKSLLSHL
ncbi:hypothetical protein M231_06840 [Tremella mesenterica]|uniref:Uncharacterized protein n=1 Tax=Tremella mesenterica TaxID=5217 RepID=A0A4V1M378_TREME|nr:hypothetical protein M231_06840 [Tremella mesenterica]